MIKNVTDGDRLDVFLATNGGSAQQVERFVYFIRNRFGFSDVGFILPSFCRSAGTLFALSGNEILMSDLACLGPIDPQIPTQNGRLVPAQALIQMIEQMRESGETNLKNKAPISWVDVKIVESLDKNELADAISSANYSIQVARSYLQTYNLSGLDDNNHVAMDIAKSLASHEKWLNHSRGIHREVLKSEIGLDVTYLTSELEWAAMRLWALCTWIFQQSSVIKFFVSSSYKYCRFERK